MSETPQQHGWQPPDLADPGAEPQLPAFTPYRAAAAFEELSSDASQPDPFPGFPSDDSYVPAPAVVPIPGVTHDAPPTAPPVTGVSDVPDPMMGGPAGSWSAFAAGEAPRHSSSFEAFGESSSDSYDGAGYDDAGGSPDSRYGAGSSSDAAYADSGYRYGNGGYEAGSSPDAGYADSGYGTGSSPDAGYADSGYGYGDGGHEAGSSPDTGYADSGHVYGNDGYGAGSEPVSPAQESMGPVTGSVRMAASVPSASRVEPSDLPSPPMPKPAGGRVYGSAAASGDAPASAVPVSPPVAYGSPPVPAPVSPADGVVKATARVSGLAQPMPGETVPSTRSSTVYGSAAGPGVAQAESAPPPFRPSRQPAFGDLLEPDSHAPGATPPSSGVGPGLQGPGVPVQRVPADAQPGFGGQGLQAPVGPEQFGPPGMARPGQAPPRPPANPKAAPTSVTEPKPERKVRLIVGVLVGCVALLAIAFGGLLVLDKLVRPPFKVGDCVKQTGESAELTDCSTEGAFKVVASVGSADECDKTQPFLKTEDEILCLKPADSP